MSILTVSSGRDPYFEKVRELIRNRDIDTPGGRTATLAWLLDQSAMESYLNITGSNEYPLFEGQGAEHTVSAMDATAQHTTSADSSAGMGVDAPDLNAHLYPHIEFGHLAPELFAQNYDPEQEQLDMLELNKSILLGELFNAQAQGADQSQLINLIINASVGNETKSELINTLLVSGSATLAGGSRAPDTHSTSAQPPEGFAPPLAGVPAPANPEPQPASVKHRKKRGPNKPRLPGTFVFHSAPDTYTSYVPSKKSSFQGNALLKIREQIPIIDDEEAVSLVTSSQWTCQHSSHLSSSELVQSSQEPGTSTQPTTARSSAPRLKQTPRIAEPLALIRALVHHRDRQATTQEQIVELEREKTGLLSKDQGAEIKMQITRQNMAIQNEAAQNITAYYNMRSGIMIEREKTALRAVDSSDPSVVQAASKMLVDHFSKPDSIPDLDQFLQTVDQRADKLHERAEGRVREYMAEVQVRPSDSASEAGDLSAPRPLRID